MWKLVDYKTIYSYNGIEEDRDGFFQLMNVSDPEIVKWVNEYDYYKLNRLGLVVK